MKLFSYVVPRDFGFAPNPFYGFCTLATCKPIIRRVADVGDWVLGTGSKGRGRGGYAVFVMRVKETLSYNQYWADGRFLLKRPNLRGSRKQAFGDNVYYRDPPTIGAWLQENSHHSYSDGSINQKNVVHDTQTDRVLISDDFIYWGGSGPMLPDSLRNHHGIDICAARGHRSRFPESLIQKFVEWVRHQDVGKYAGAPLDWS